MKMKYLLLSFLFLFFLSELSALPRFSLRGGGGDCMGCHVNPTGGVLRNRSGWSFGKNVLPMISPSDDFKMSNMIGDNIQIGMDLRGQTLLMMTSDRKRIDFQRMSGSIYTGLALSENINVVTRYDFVQQIWEAYGVLHILPNNSYIKGGVFQPNYGIRLDDHTAYTRGGDMGLLSNSVAGLIYDPFHTQSGVEAGFYFGEEFVLLTLSAGSPPGPLFRDDPVYTASLKLQPSIGDDAAMFAGASYTTFRRSPTMPVVNMYGGYAGFGIGNFTLMGEYDMASDYAAIDTETSALMIEAAYRIIKGLEAVVRLDRFDPVTDVEEDELTRVVIGFEIFPYSFIEIRPQYRIQMEEPSVDNDSAVIQFHIWY